VENPFDNCKNQFLGTHSRKVRSKKRQKQNLDHIKDEDLKSELRGGKTLISYFESQPQ
jgi:hypothetical protein